MFERVSESALSAMAEQVRDLGLSLDLLVEPDVLPTVADLALAFPGLRVIVNHVGLVPIDGKSPDAAWHAALERVAESDSAYCKVSGLVELAGIRPARTDDEFYAPTLDAVWDTFGEDRLLYASDWPACTPCADYATVHGIAERFIESKGASVAEKIWCRNAQSAYALTSTS